MDPKLNNQQIATLYQFTRDHYVTHYDVQTELVDHLANAIEAQWQEYPNRSFTAALTLAFKEFGVFGFQDVIAAKKKAMSQRYRGLLWQELKTWFHWPKQLCTLLATIFVYWLMQWLGQFSFKAEFINGFLLLLILLGTIHYLATQKARKQKAVHNGKTLLLAEIIYNFQDIYMICYIPIYLLFSLNQWVAKICYSSAFDLLFSLGLVSLLLAIYTALKVLPAKATSILAKTYPAYKMAD